MKYSVKWPNGLKIYTRLISLWKKTIKDNSPKPLIWFEVECIKERNSVRTTMDVEARTLKEAEQVAKSILPNWEIFSINEKNDG